MAPKKITSVFQFILSNERILAAEKEVIEVLTCVGFDEECQKSVIAPLSGDWKMKLVLAPAMLFKADIILLDEPTNHLNVVTHCTSVVVAHDDWSS